VRSTGTAETIEKDDVIGLKLPKACGVPFCVVAGFQYSFGNAESLPAEFHHFRHERQLIERSVSIECLEDFLRSPHFYKITGAEPYCRLCHERFW
jgi:hypothetical protein